MQHAKEKYQEALRSIEREARMYVFNWNCAMSCGVSKYIYVICPTSYLPHDSSAFST